MLYATLPAPQLRQMATVAREPLIGGVRFNIGARTPYGEKEALQRILAAIGNKEFWLDLKGRQPRIVQWAVPTYGDIVLNHRIKSLDLPAEIVLRNDTTTNIVAFDGNRIFVDPQPTKAVGAGQAVNIHGTNLEIEGYFTEEDIRFVEVGKDMGIHRYMLSYVEQESDIAGMIELDPMAQIIAKIETPEGLEFVERVYPSFGGSVRLMAALDDMYLNIGPDKTAIFKALETIISADPNAIAASRLFLSLMDNGTVSLPDLTHFCFLEAMGYQSFMLSDNLCKDSEAFRRTMAVIRQYNERQKPKEMQDRVRDYLKRFKIWR